MTTQDKKTPKAIFYGRLTNENYDFLYSMSDRGDKSLARVLNEIIETARKSNIASCESNSERVMVK